MTVDLTIGEIVAKDFRKAEVFKKFGIDFCCGGKKTIHETCSKKGINEGDVFTALEAVDNQTTDTSLDFNIMPMAELVDYIITKHHAYVKESSIILTEFLSKVARVHGGNHPELIMINDLFLEAKAELDAHMRKEEMILFPYIKNLSEALSLGATGFSASFGSVLNPIQMMEYEHESVGDIFKEINKLSANYNPPEGACATYRVSFLKLQEFENDLFTHIHLENNILFPRAVEAENQLTKL